MSALMLRARKTIYSEMSMCVKLVELDVNIIQRIAMVVVRVFLI